MNDTCAKPPLQTLRDAVTDIAGIHLRLLRLDLVHPLLQGNKWYKLRRNLEVARERGCDTLLSFGGAYSNHIHALAAAGKLYGFRTIGVIRGELVQPLNPVLAFAVEQGMQLLSVSRSAYRNKHTPEFADWLYKEVDKRLGAQFNDFHAIPEGGANLEGVLGCREISDHFEWSVPAGNRHVYLACGTGTTLAGILAGLSQDSARDCHITGVSALKGGGFLVQDVRHWLQKANAHDPGNWCIETDWHCGGYAKTTPALLDFISDFERSHQIPLEPIYTGKLMHGLYGRILAGGFAPGSEIIAIHTGGVHSR